MGKNMKIDYKKIYKDLILIREVEEAIVKNYGVAGSSQNMRCPVHLSIGQEAAAVGVCHFLEKEDNVFSTHRCHAHYLAKGGDLKKMLLEIHGKLGGCMDGRGGSMHLMDVDVGMMASVPIVASSIPLAVGDALANKIDKKSNVSVCFFGDACVEEGVFHESVNFASLMNLPVIFVCENNLFSVYTHIDERQPNRDLEELGRAHKIKSVRVDGNDILEVARISESLINEAREKSQPSFLILDTYRQREHCGVNYDDNLSYRDEKEVQEWNSRDPIQMATKMFNEKNIISPDTAEEIKKQIQSDIEVAFEYALKADYPQPYMAARHVFSE
jgi:pyruvate dehydrogenase E1 component alpha subunit